MLIIESYAGQRAQIRALYEQADDSPAEIDGYIESGEVLVARHEEEVAGHVQLIPSDVRWEIKSIAVLESLRRRGIGTALVQAAIAYARSRGCIQLVVGTATADIDNLRFYQRRGFRMDRIERDVFTADRGYPEHEWNGIQVRDRVWLSIDFVGSPITQSSTARSAPFVAETTNPESIAIRPAVPEDAAGIAPIFLESAGYHARLDPERYVIPVPERIFARYRKGLQNSTGGVGTGITLVAVSSDEIVGFVEARLDRSPDPMHREMIYCDVAEIAVSSRHQNRGIGGQLLRAAEEWGRRHGAEVASLEYHAANTRVAEFYQRRMGYRIAAITAIKNL